MTKEETIAILAIIKTAYPRFYSDMDETSAKATINLWASMFQEDELETVKLALYKLISTSEFPPTIAAVRGAISETINGDLPTAGSAWGEVIRGMRNFGYTGEEKALREMNPLTVKAVKCIGWNTLCLTNLENIMTDRAHFFKIYSGIVEREKEERNIPLALTNKIQEKISTNNHTPILIDRMSETPKVESKRNDDIPESIKQFFMNLKAGVKAEEK